MSRKKRLGQGSISYVTVPALCLHWAKIGLKNESNILQYGPNKLGRQSKTLFHCSFQSSTANLMPPCDPR